jgi:hypothetical protein
MPANDDIRISRQNSTSAAIVQVNTLSEDIQAVNPADHDGNKN